MIMRRGGANNDSAGKGQGIVAVAVDGDKNSQYALRWAGDHLLARGQIFYLLHIRKKMTTVPTIHGSIPISDVDEEVAAQFREQRDHQTKELLLPFQCFCSRRGCKEIVLDETDVGKVIVDFVMRRSVDKLVVGASNHGPIAGAFIRAFAKPDVPTAVCKAAPDFCSVYVIQKGCKIVSVRPASCPHTSSKRPNNIFSGEIESTDNNASFQSVKSDPNARECFEATLRQSSDNQRMLKSSYNYRINDRIGWNDTDHESVRSLESYTSCPSPTRSSIDVNSPSSGRIRNDSPNNNNGGRLLPPPSGSNNHDNSFYEDAMDDLEAQLERLKHKMKKTTEIALADKHDWDFKSYLREPRSDSTEENKKAIAPISQRKAMPAPPETREKRKLIEGFTSDITYHRYSTDEMNLATDYFSDALKVGEGGYGPVYKATLDDTTVAIKALRSDVSSTQGMKQFQQELEVLSSITHPNMVRLVGACPEYGCLVYEYMSYGNLEERLECRSETPPLPWQLRFRIAFDIATGLLFLHQQTPEPLVHRDLKPANILLDHNLVAKISDVGLARLIPSLPGGASNVTMYHMTAAAGTFCYIDPEYQKTGLVCTKSDVYALGIIFLQLVTGRGPMGLTYNVMNALEANNLADILDPKVPDWPIDETKRLVELALQCAELRRKDRPDLASVIWPEVMNLAAFAESNHDTEFFMQHQRLKMANGVTVQ